MTSRQRQSTATPAQRRAANESPPYEKATFPLNPAAQRALAQLQQTLSFKKLDDRFQEAQVALSTSAAEINDRLTEKENAVKKRRNGEASQDTEGGAGDDELENLRDRVDRMTQRMDESMRKTIDGRHSVQAINDSFSYVITEARANASTQASTQPTQTQRSRRRPPGLDDEDDEDDADDADYRDFTPTDPTGGTQARPSPMDTFKSKIEDANTRYQNHSFTARYAEDNDYRNFRKVVHDAKYPDDEVPLSHHSEWFKEQDAPAPGVTTRARNGAGEDEDDDLAISKARISTKCPLTLAEFNTPLTSTKCPHSFESEAILSMINTSTNRVNGRPNGDRYVQCPVPGCSQMLTRADLHTDPALVRKIKRIQRAKQLENEEMEDGEPRGTQRSVVIEDNEGVDVDDIVEGRQVAQTQVKGERVGMTSTAPPPSTAPRSTAIVDLDLDTETDNEAEEDVEMED